MKSSGYVAVSKRDEILRHRNASRGWKNATKDVYKKFEDAIPNVKQLYEMIVAARG